MALTINSNLASLTAQRNLSSSQSQMNTALERLSSGKRINNARDDAAGFAIAERMDAQARGMAVAMRNASDGISLTQVAEGGLDEIGSMLQRMRQLAVQSANGSNTSSDQNNLQAEFTQLNGELNRITTITEFNGFEILGADAGTFTFQVGANSSDTTSVTTANLTAITADIGSTGNANAAIDDLDAAIDEVTTLRSSLGAAQSRFASAIGNLRVGMESQAAARSRIVDADFAVETSNFTRAQILQQAGTAMVAQANAQPRTIMSLLG